MCSAPPEAPPDSVHAIQLSTVPRQTSRPARSPLLASSHAALVDRLVRCDRPAVLGLGRQAFADRAQVLPAEPGADRLARRSIPQDRAGPLVGDTDGGRSARRPRSSTVRAASSSLAAMSAASNSTSPPNGDTGGQGRYSSARSVNVSSTIARPQAGRADVDHEDGGHGRSDLVEGVNPLAWRRAPSRPPTTPASSTRPRVKKTPNQFTSRPAIRRITTNTACVAR